MIKKEDDEDYEKILWLWTEWFMIMLILIMDH